METFSNILSAIDDFVWGPVMLILLVGTGILLTIRTRFLGIRNLGYALKIGLGKEARKKTKGDGDISPFSGSTAGTEADDNRDRYTTRPVFPSPTPYPAGNPQIRKSSETA